MKHTAATLAFVMIAAACGGTETTTDNEPTSTTQGTVDAAAATTTTSAAEPAVTTAAPTTTQSPTTTAAATTTTMAPPEPVLSQDGDTWTIVWASTDSPFWAPASPSAADPFFHIHTFAANDGFFFSLEMYTTGYGALWTGELGDVDVSCMEAVPGANSTGICPYFDPDGPGGVAVKSAFVATGSITINQLDENGYDIVVNEIVYPDGTTIAGFQLTGP